jgi:hypothetical protein
MSLHELSERFRGERLRRAGVESATITVRRIEEPAGQRRFRGRVFIDAKLVGDLISNEARCFDVEPGEHTIAVRFGRRPVIFQATRRAKAVASVSLTAGEQAEFVCGVRPEVVRLWVSARQAVQRRACAGVAVSGLLMSGLYWFIGPYVREAAAFAVIHLPIGPALIPLIYRLAPPILLCLCPAMLLAWIVRRWPHLHGASDSALLSQFGSPYYLERLV